MADTSISDALKIETREELQDWLESLPPEKGREVAVAIAARAALRIIPLVAATTPFGNDAAHNRDFENLTFAVFFATALARVAAIYPARANGLRAAAAAAFAGAYAADHVPAVDARAYAAGDAAGAARAYAVDAARGYAFSAAANAASATRVFADGDDDTIWAVVSRDANFVASGGTAGALASRALWPDGAPEWAGKNWKLLQRAFSREVNMWHPPSSDTRMRLDALPRKDDWQVWIDWYNHRLEGASNPEEIELVFATVPDEERETGPTAANKWIRERLEELARKKLTVPPILPAAIEPVIADGKIALPTSPAEVDLDSEMLGAALMALRTQIADLAGDLDVEANIDKRVISFLRQLAEKIPQAPPAQAQLFMLAHEQEALEAYGKTVVAEWPGLLTGRYLATTLAFDRTVRQFPKWRLFKQNADKNRLTDQQRAEAPKLTADFAAALREEEAAEYVAAEIPDTFEEMSRRLDAARDEAREDRIAAGDDTLAEDAVISIENMLKLMAETTLSGVKRAANAVTKAGVAYVDNFEEGMVDQAKKEGKKDSAALVKCSKRILVGAAVGAGAKTAGIGAVIAKLMVTYPQIGKWLGPIIDLISN